MTDHDYGYWIIQQNGAPVAAIRAKVIDAASYGHFCDFGHGVYDAVKHQDTAVAKAFCKTYKASANQYMIGGVE